MHFCNCIKARWDAVSCRLVNSIRFIPLTTGTNYASQSLFYRIVHCTFHGVCKVYITRVSCKVQSSVQVAYSDFTVIHDSTIADSLYCFLDTTRRENSFLLYLKKRIASALFLPYFVHSPWTNGLCGELIQSMHGYKPMLSLTQTQSPHSRPLSHWLSHEQLNTIKNLHFTHSGQKVGPLFESCPLRRLWMTAWCQIQIGLLHEH